MHNAFFSTDNTQLTRGEYLYIILYMKNNFKLIIFLKRHSLGIVCACLVSIRLFIGLVMSMEQQSFNIFR
jgi:hypothetical protein